MEKVLKDIDGIYFDFFGTLIDSRYILTNIWAQIANRLGTEINPDDKCIWEGMLKQSDEVDKLRKKTFPEYKYFIDFSRKEINMLNSNVLAAMGVDNNEGSELVIMEEFENGFGNVKCFRLNPGCRKTLEQISNKGIKLGILSNASSKGCKTRLDNLGILDFFDIFINATDYGYNKSQIEVYQMALKAMKTESPEYIVHVGDDPFMDVQMAQKVGMIPVLLNPYNLHSLENVISIRELPELLNHLY